MKYMCLLAACLCTFAALFGSDSVWTAVNGSLAVLNFGLFLTD